uniref:Uncharacterized protein n=1 Tax=Timema shepardi TaxID=629360 RepID=A0A7R9G083_TIMSH|nr:unnamed protein product [Timema shepardi]
MSSATNPKSSRSALATVDPTLSDTPILSHELARAGRRVDRDILTFDCDEVEDLSVDTECRPVITRLTQASGRNFELTHSRSGVDSVNISCKAEGLFPEPKMVLFKDPDRKDKTGMEGVVVETASKEGVYDIKATKIIEYDDLQSTTMFDCELRIPEANYVVRKSIVYYPAGALNNEVLAPWTLLWSRTPTLLLTPSSTHAVLDTDS